MKKSFFLFLISIIFISLVEAQIAPDKYWVQFTDKNGTPYSLDAPEEFLSARAIERRLVQGIEFTENDLPVNPAYL